MDSYFTKVLQEAPPKVEPTKNTGSVLPSETTKQFLRFVPGLIMFAWLLLLAWFHKTDQATITRTQEAASSIEERHAGIRVSSAVVK